MIRPGLCSVTFRGLEVPHVIELAVGAGLSCIEWAGDAHVPPGDARVALRARELTERAGLAVASYGSYLRFDAPTDAAVRTEGDEVLTSALALGAPRVRVWAGSTGSAETEPQHRDRIVSRIRDFADRAGAHGIDVGLEFHGRTLTDEITSTLQLLEEIDRERVSTYWQPHQGMPAPDAIDTLRRALPRTSTIHVFSWWPRDQRLPLTARSELWREAFTLLAGEGSERDALLEFVPDDDPALLRREASTLRELIAAGEVAAGRAGGTDDSGESER